MVILYLFAVLLVSQATAEHAKYHGHKVLKIMPKNHEDTKLVLKLVERFGGTSEGAQMMHGRLKRSILKLNDQTLVEYWDDIIGSTGLGCNKGVSSWMFGTHITMTVPLMCKSTQKCPESYHGNSTSYMYPITPGRVMYKETILKETFSANGVAPSGEPILSELSSIGTTLEGKSIHMIKVYKPSTTAKKAIFVDGGIHAREWISPAFLLYLIHQLKYNPSNSTDVEFLVNTYDWYLVPVLNPDGYRYSWNSDRLWRKNRRDNAGSSCHGVDLNRNFGYMWNPDNGGSKDECAQTYSGVGGFSEPESQAVRNFLNSDGIDFLSYLTIHSYGQMWLYPWGFTSALPSDSADLDAAAGVAINELRKRHNTRYVKGSSTNVLYAAAGGSDDYAKGGACIKYSYTLELRDTGRHGFVLPENLIVPTCEETMDAIIAFAKFLATASNYWDC